MMTRPAPVLTLLVVVAALANADPDQQRRTPAGLTPFNVALPAGTFGQWTVNKFQIANSGAAHQVPPGNGPWEVDVLECEVLSSYWTTQRGDVTYLGSTTSPLNPIPTADKYEINGYIYPRDGQPAPNGEAWQCYNDAASYWTKPYMAKARQTFVLPRGVTRFTANNHPFESSATWNLVRFRSAPENCISSAGNFFIPKDGVTNAANAAKVCSDLGGTLADVTFKNIAEINGLARGCQGGNKKFHVAGWNGYDYGLGSMVFTSSATSDGTGAVTIPDGGSYLPICDRVKEKLTRRTSGNDLVLFTSTELMDYTQGRALCNAENRDLLNLNAPAPTLTEQQKKATPWYRARALLFTTTGRFSSAYIGSFNNDPYTGSCIAFFNGGNSAAEIGAVSVPPGGCEGSKTNGVFCGPVRAGEPVRRSEL